MRLVFVINARTHILSVQCAQPCDYLFMDKLAGYTTYQLGPKNSCAIIINIYSSDTDIEVCHINLCTF